MTPHRRSRHERGVSTIEFALLAPVLLLIVLGGLEAAHTLYVRALLIGQLQKAGRDVSLEGASGSTQLTTIEDSVRSTVQNVMAGATVDFDLKSYHDYANVRSPAEEFKDTNIDGRCDNGESFVDSNGNGRWDADGGVGSRGGAKDVVVLTSRVSYDRLALGKFFPWGGDRIEFEAKTLLRNQPSDKQATPSNGTCA